jgi:hypothetical protein
MPWGQRSATIVDPDGNLIEFGSFNRGNKMEDKAEMTRKK